MSKARAIILPLEMLTQNPINVMPFLSFLNGTKKRSGEEREFSFEYCKDIIHQFNRNEISSDEFMEKILKQTYLENKISADDFWRAWNEIFTIGNLKEELNKVKTQINTPIDDLLYLTCSLNTKHFEKLISECKNENLSVNTHNNNVTIDNVPLIVSKDFKKDSFDLIKECINNIKEKTVKKPAEILVILNYTGSLIDPKHRELHGKKVRDLREIESVRVIIKEHYIPLSQALHPQTLEQNPTPFSYCNIL